MSAGSYGGFKEVADPTAAQYEDRFRHLDALTADGEYQVDVNGDGEAESFDDPDFNMKQFRSNAVLRWEYRPGSALFLVWSRAGISCRRGGETSTSDPT